MIGVHLGVYLGVHLRIHLTHLHTCQPLQVFIAHSLFCSYDLLILHICRHLVSVRYTTVSVTPAVTPALIQFPHFVSIHLVQSLHYFRYWN